MALIKYSTFQLLLGQVGLHIVHHIPHYDNYTHSVEWSRGNNTFIKRPLEEKELLEINSLY
jgi:hypothetical protein